MEPRPELLALLGKPCSWISTTDGENKKGFVMAIRLDEKVQTSESLFQIPGDVIWRHFSLITLDKNTTLPMQKNLPVTRTILPTMPDVTLTNQATECALANNQHSKPPTQVALGPKMPMAPRFLHRSPPDG